MFSLHRFVAKLTDFIRSKANSEEEESGENFDRHFPSLLWVIRDFTLKPEKNGKVLSDDEYLEDALKIKPGTKAEIMKANATKQIIKDVFKVGGS